MPRILIDHARRTFGPSHPLGNTVCDALDEAYAEIDRLTANRNTWLNEDGDGFSFNVMNLAISRIETWRNMPISLEAEGLILAWAHFIKDYQIGIVPNDDDNEVYHGWHSLHQ